ncbi:MAG: NAD-dependent epimerase/dehydratase family protein [Candidatus Poribacteria bacterium]
MKYHNSEKTCWNCPCIDFKGSVDFRACGQSMKEFLSISGAEDMQAMVECKRRPGIGMFDPASITFEDCPEWGERDFGYALKNMKVMILGIDGYLGWTLALWLGSLGFNVSGVDNYYRRDWVMEKGSHTVVPIAKMSERLRVAKEVLNIDINFRKMNILDRPQLREFIDEVKPEVIVHYAECPSAPYSMVDAEHAIFVQHNNVIGTLGLLFTMRDSIPEASLIKLGCYDDKTEILTEDGWKLFEDLEENDKVATRSKDNRKLVFKKPNSIHEYDYQGKMYYQKNGRVDFCVTPNHRMFTQGCSRASYEGLRLETVQDVEGRTRVYDIGFDWEGKDQEYFILSSTDGESTEIKIPMDLWLKFLGWYISEGSIRQRNDRPNNYRVTIKQNIHAENIDELEEILLSLAEVLGRELRKRQDGNCYVFSIGCKQLASYLSKFGKAAEKYIPKEIKQLNKDLLNSLLLSLIEGDGWKHTPASNRENYRYFTISKQLADDVQEIALKCGYGAIVSYSESKKGYQINICQTPRIHVNHGESTDGYVDYDGKVWCVNVGGDGIVFVRRNGKPVWSGNTMGEYGSPLTGRPLFEGLFPADAALQWDNREWSLGGELTPRDPVSFYHCSKVQDTFNIYEACKYWWLRSYDVMQGVIYGVYTDQVAADPRLRTRFDVDEWFGTVINRFVAQAVAGIPLTIYGSGGQTRGFIALRDAMQCMTRLIVAPPEPGQYDVVNQISGVYRIEDLAYTVANIAANEFDLPVKIQRLENPRIEADEHPYEVIYEKLPNGFGFEPKVSLEDEVYEMLKLLMRPEVKRRIEEKRDVIMPKTRWSGLKKEMEVLETYTVTPKRRSKVVNFAAGS